MDDPSKVSETEAGQTANRSDESSVPGVTEETILLDSSSQIVNSNFLPAQIGRYRIDKILGEGGFARVYLGYDSELKRQVAIKVPLRERVSQLSDFQAYLVEARTLASLDHPGILPVHDVGRTDDGLLYVVSKFIEGTDLQDKLERERLTYHESADLVATVAEALHYAHTKGLVHRDVKPANILIDSAGRPYVADFGLALKEEDIGCGSGWAGTPSYMSPEQARGEGHRVDGRSDIFSVGIMLYEMLTGKRPFHGETPQKLLEQIASVEARPLRQRDDSVPKELERICLKALSKKASDRYTAAKDLADDLRHFLRESPQTMVAGPVASVDSQLVSSAEVQIGSGSSSAVGLSESQAVRIVPKGLRSFDEHDADFFLELLPGPRDREALPDSIRFWKTQIEETDADQTFSVGLIYGPSGCGKSSLVKAGLLPRCSEDVLPVYIEATPKETETRLLHGLRKKCPALEDNFSLRETLTALRRGQGSPAGKKVLIVLDQFEQWLHANKEEENTELVQALRQCDGGRVQCIVMVRDDFWMAATRFGMELEIDFVPGVNMAPVDLFPVRHAEKVLAAFGRAFGTLPDELCHTTKDQKEFIKQSVADLAEEGKVICVRLALFAEMMKGREWTPVTLKHVGGTSGLGVTFLEETFSGPTAVPRHRLHQKAARAVLRDLLPDPGTDIKGRMRSRAELLEASGYRSRPKDFDDLIRILDSEIRLITPTDPAGQELDDESETQLEAGQNYFQLTHDYLVRSLRDWLTRKQKETRRGRAEIRLDELQASWSVTSESRHLPGLVDWLRISVLTSRRNWSPAERQMMAAARRHHGLRLGGLLIVLVLAAFVEVERRKSSHVSALVRELSSAHISEIPVILEQLKPYRDRSTPLLRAFMQQPAGSRARLHASLALAGTDPALTSEFLDQILSADHAELRILCDILDPYRAELMSDLWEVVAGESEENRRRVNAAHALAFFDPPLDDESSARWEKIAPFVANELVTQTLQNLRAFPVLSTDFDPVGDMLFQPLARDCHSSDARRRSVATSLIVEFSGDDPNRLATLVPDADLNQFHSILDRLSLRPEPAIRALTAAVTRPPPATTDSKLLTTQAESTSRTAAALLRLGVASEAVWRLLRHSRDPTARSLLIRDLAIYGVAPEPLIERLQVETDASILRALLQALGEFDRARFSRDQLQELHHLARSLLSDSDAGSRASAEWLLRRHQADPASLPNPKRPATEHGAQEIGWFVNSQSQRMIVIDARNDAVLKRVFAIADREVTVEQFRRFAKGYEPYRNTAPTDNCPANLVSWYGAVSYCNWLTRQEGLGDEALCYYENPGTGHLTPHLDLTSRNGYRLAVHAEWTYACRAGCETPYYFGRAESLANAYAWTMDNSDLRLWPGGLLKPNEFGLFDMHGNAMEWSNNYRGDNSRELRGGSSKTNVLGVAVDNVNAYLPDTTFYSIGFRVTKSMDSQELQIQHE